MVQCSPRCNPRRGGFIPFVLHTLIHILIIFVQKCCPEGYSTQPTTLTLSMCHTDDPVCWSGRILRVERGGLLYLRLGSIMYIVACKMKIPLISTIKETDEHRSYS